jgi:hypothetical protein
MADAAPPEAIQPGPGTLDHPAVAAKSWGGVDHAPGDPWSDATLAGRRRPLGIGIGGMSSSTASGMVESSSTTRRATARRCRGVRAALTWDVGNLPFTGGLR